MESVLYVAGKELGALAAAIQNGLDDKKLTLAEDIDIGKKLVAVALDTFKNRAELGANFKDNLDEAEQADLESGFKDGYVLTNPASEAAVETALQYGLSIMSGIAGLFIKKA